ncbi:hypothetical protein EYC80_009850 [Monilinia laxa]|uniref:Histone chaperone domain-containing protein n=1 Tax=Monilinia laxa TaxID=61186 RepID=A0A5N6JQX3_MONLA|nr:hypothetical protein EYC80_009850 [Monilinia laxa]
MSSTPDIPQGTPTNNDYVSRPGHKQEPIPVQSDGAAIEDPIAADTANSDAQLERDDKEAIDKSNIIDSKTRGAAKSTETYREPGDEEGLPTNDGTSAVAQ